jgi:precorrin-3B synthase
MAQSAGFPAAGLLGEQPFGVGAFVGVGLPFGRTIAEDLKELAFLAAANGTQALRLTPWRAILLPVPTRSAARSVAARLAEGPFILDPADPRRRIAACSGAPSCASGSRPTRSDAAALATEIAGMAGSGIVLHVSGCAKGCAHPTPAPLTLVARDGAYDLVRDGLASTSPDLRGMTLDQVARHLRRLAGPPPGGASMGQTA